MICPAAQLEHLLQEKYGTDIFFLTALGGVFCFNEPNYTEPLLALIEREAIVEIVFVNDTSCRFISSVLEAEPRLGFTAEYALIDLLIDRYYHVMRAPTLHQQKIRLATLNLRQQADKLKATPCFQQFCRHYPLQLKGLITTKSAGSFMEIPLTPTNQTYESALTDR